MVYATLGATRSPLGHEVVLAAAASFPAFRRAVEAVVRARPDSATPLGVVLCPIPGTPFEGLLVLPPSEGTLTPAEADGRSSLALRVVPVTGPERRQAENDPLRLLARLRTAGALVAAPERDCVVAPRGLAPRATREAIREAMKRNASALDALTQGFRDRLAAPAPEPPPEILVAAVLERWSSLHTPPWSAEERELLAAILPSVQRALRPFLKLVHPGLLDFMRTLVVATLVTHPDAGGLTGRPVAAGSTAEDVEAAVERARQELARFLGRTERLHDTSELLEQGAIGVAKARDEFDPRDGFPFANQAWKWMLRTMVDHLVPLPSHFDKVERVVRTTGEGALLLELGPDGRPAPRRLDEVTARLATGMFASWAGPEALRADPSPPPAKKRKPDAPPRRGRPTGREHAPGAKRRPLDAAAARALYAERFGPVTWVDQRLDRSYEALTLGAPGEGREVVHATLGLTKRPARAEVWIAAAPGWNVDGGLDALAAVEAPLAPLQVRGWEHALAPFVAVLVLPFEDGALVLDAPDGTPRRALRAAMLTEAEYRLAKQAPLDVVERLRRAGALVADPLRACTVEPEETRAARWDTEREIVSRAGRSLFQGTERLERLVELGAPDPIIAKQRHILERWRALLAHVDRAPPPGPGGPQPERHAPYSFHRASPPSPLRVARRALVMAALVYRGFLEVGRAREELGLPGDTPGGEEGRRQLLAFRAALDLQAEEEPLETLALETPVGALDRQRANALTWHGSALDAVAWALGRLPLPDLVEPAALPAAVRAVGLLGDEAGALVQAPVLRSAGELRALLDRAYALAWRLDEFLVHKQPMDFAALGEVPRFWFGRLALDGLPLVDRDLVVRGKPLAAFNHTALEAFQMHLAFRHRAASWLAGIHPLFGESPCTA